eukprot:1327248-Pyramimonas_sp.AAC.1
MPASPSTLGFSVRFIRASYGTAVCTFGVSTNIGQVVISGRPPSPSPIERGGDRSSPKKSLFVSRGLEGHARVQAKLGELLRRAVSCICCRLRWVTVLSNVAG